MARSENTSPSIKTFHKFINEQPLFATLLTSLICVILHYIRIPLPGTPVPLVIQPLGSFCAGAFLGPWYGLLSQLIYLAALPFTIWSSIGGVAMLWGPTSGYMWGIVASSFIFGMLVRQHRSYANTAFQLYVITAAYIYLPGMLVLRTWYSFANHPVPAWSVLIGQAIIPFLFGDLLKAIAAAYIITRTRRI